MDGNISPTGPEWQYQQVIAKLREIIAGLGDGAPLPSEKQLAQTFGVTDKTVRRAIRILAAEGVVETIPSRGSFVKRR